MSPLRSIPARGSSGFTLVELLVVVLIVGILAAIALPRFLGQRTRTKNAAAQAAVRHALVAARSYYTQNSETYVGLGPTQLQGYESSLGTTEPADSIRPGDATANPQNIWIGNGLDGTNPNTVAAGDPNGGNTVVLCSVSKGDTVYCVKDVNGVASYLSSTGTVGAAGASSGFSPSGWGSSTSSSAPSAAAAFSYKKQLTVSTASGGAGLSGGLSDFPVQVVVNASSWPTQTERDHFFAGNNNVTGKRVRFFASDGTVLPYEVERFTASSEAIYWVKVPSLSLSDSANVIWLGYGNDPNGSDQDQATDVWNSGFVGVWHLNGSRNDSTSYTNHLNQYGTVTYAAGVSGSALDLPGDSSAWAYLATDTNTELRTTTACTYEGWASPDTVSGSNYILHNEGRGAWYDGRGVALLYAGSAPNAKPYFKGGDGSGSWIGVAGSTTVPTGANSYLAGTYDNSSLRVYLNGTQDGILASANKTWSFDRGVGNYPSPPTLYVAGDHNNGGTGNTDLGAMANYWHDGRLEELRISNVARSADWLRATYFSMKKISWSGDGWLNWAAETS